MDLNYDTYIKQEPIYGDEALITTLPNPVYDIPVKNEPITDESPPFVQIKSEPVAETSLLGDFVGGTIKTENLQQTSSTVPNGFIIYELEAPLMPNATQKLPTQTLLNKGHGAKLDTRTQSRIPDKRITQLNQFKVLVEPDLKSAASHSNITNNNKLPTLPKCETKASAVSTKISVPENSAKLPTLFNSGPPVLLNSQLRKKHKYVILKPETEDKRARYNIEGTKAPSTKPLTKSDRSAGPIKSLNKGRKANTERNVSSGPMKTLNRGRISISTDPIKSLNRGRNSNSPRNAADSIKTSNKEHASILTDSIKSVNKGPNLDTQVDVVNSLNREHISVSTGPLETLNKGDISLSTVPVISLNEGPISISTDSIKSSKKVHNLDNEIKISPIPKITFKEGHISVPPDAIKSTNKVQNFDNEINISPNPKITLTEGHISVSANPIKSPKKVQNLATKINISAEPILNLNEGYISVPTDPINMGHNIKIKVSADLIKSFKKGHISVSADSIKSLSKNHNLETEIMDSTGDLKYLDSKKKKIINYLIKSLRKQILPEESSTSTPEKVEQKEITENVGFSRAQGLTTAISETEPTIQIDLTASDPSSSLIIPIKTENLLQTATTPSSSLTIPIKTENLLQNSTQVPSPEVPTSSFSSTQTKPLKSDISNPPKLSQDLPLNPELRVKCLCSLTDHSTSDNSNLRVFFNQMFEETRRLNKNQQRKVKLALLQAISDSEDLVEQGKCCGFQYQFSKS